MPGVLQTTRSLLDPATDIPPFTEEEQWDLQSRRAQAPRSIKLARLLLGGGFEAEADLALREALLASAVADAICSRQSKPAGWEEIASQPRTDRNPALREALEKCLRREPGDLAAALEGLETWLAQLG